MNKYYYKLLLLLFLLGITNAYANTERGKPATIPVTQLSGFQNYSPINQKLVKEALSLAGLGLTYTYGSANPAVRGMDCSGTINYLLSEMSVKKVPRTAEELYKWVVAEGHFHSVNSISFDSAEFDDLKVGDLLFWSGTYKANSFVTHVMLYIGKNKEGKPLMFGASDGRTYEGIQRWGVSVFDFTLPSASSQSRFLGFGCIPTLTC